MAGRRIGAGLALAAVALSAAGCGVGGGTKTVTVVRTHTVTTTQTVTTTSAALSDCTGGELSGTFTVVSGSQGAGQISYLLTLKNTSSASCALTSHSQLVLLDASGSPLPTNVTGMSRLPQASALAPGGSASATARFYPDVPGSGDSSSGACQPKAHTLQVTPEGGGTVDVPITPPTSVCERGTLTFPS